MPDSHAGALQAGNSEPNSSRCDTNPRTGRANSKGRQATMEPARERIPREARDDNLIGLRGAYGQVTGSCGTCLVPIIAIIGVAAGELVAVWWPQAGAIVLAIVLISVAYALVVVSSGLFDKDQLALASYAYMVSWISTGIIVSTVFFVCIFAEFSRHVFIAFGGFSSPDQSVLTWAEFAVQEWIDTVTLGISSIYGGISHVDASAWWSKTFILVPYHLYCAAFLVVAIKSGISLSRAEARDEILGG